LGRSQEDGDLIDMWVIQQILTLVMLIVNVKHSADAFGEDDGVIAVPEL